MAIQQSSVVGLFILLVVQAAQDVPGVSARSLFNTSSTSLVSGLKNPLKAPSPSTPEHPSPPGILSSITNALKAPPMPPLGSPSVPALNIPGAGNIVSGITAGLKAPLPSPKIPGVADIASGITAGLMAPLPSPKIPGAGDIVSGITAGLKAPLPSVELPGAGDLTSGISSALKAPPLGGLGGLLPTGSSSSTAQDAAGLTISESVSISSPGLGSTAVTATTVIPPLDKIRTPDLKGIFSGLLPKSSPPPPPPSQPSSASLFPGLH
ncbi:hypothetical protein MPTK1_8g00740 [Marchantia polymorpha subsp. ruderalis]|uniref:Uncharacterized protein n=1 Tax=Marchantia polymorpha TaxID=3197 RepID=A0A2R6WLE4_MARPO|nr:hypothetical protein MARPO_0077s0001 [Marchantia polymorpha]BBN18221.1 hypothetical protein Mp_8g00740 [Marchantia polymorpha subsp. ruderalis]|eukprot:PTQ34665.1 hypothetical protein MARPO_0077s0001 [Marchantia polymorpha]